MKCDRCGERTSRTANVSTTYGDYCSIDCTIEDAYAHDILTREGNDDA